MESKSTRELGFTLIELLIVIAVISLLIAMAIPQYLNYRVQGHDSVAKSDFKNVMTALENYYLENDNYPATSADLLANGFQLSKNVCFTKYTLENSGSSVHMHIMNTRSTNAWHTKYPDDSGTIAPRNPASCI